MVSNFLPPDSQPWVRTLENKIKTLETTITSLKKATTSRVSSAITTPGNVLTLGGEKVPGEGVLNGSLEHLNGAYTLRYGHEFHGLTQYVLIVSGKASGAGELSLLGPEGQVLDSDTLETDVDDVNEFYFAVEFPILTMNYEFEPEDEDGGGPDTDQEVVSSYVLPDTGTLSLVTGATLSELSYEIRSANSSQVTIDTSSGVPAITGLSADGTTIDVMNDYSDTLEILEDALEEARQELADARTEAEQNFDELDDKLGQAFPDDIFDVDLAIEGAKDLSEQRFADAITGTVVEYARNTSETEAPTTGWSMTPPDRTPGSFIWMRTTVSYGSGDATTNEPVLLTGNDGTPAVLLRIDSSRGTAFKNNMISTVLSVTIFFGDKQINNIYDLHDTIGPASYLEWFWRRIDDDDFGLISSSDDRLGNAGFTLTVSPDDVDEQTVFQCVLKK